MSLFTVVMLPLLLSLGAWQLERAALKRSLESMYLERLTALPVAPSVAALQQPFTRLKLEGWFEEELFLLDNQVSAGVTGYWLVQVFRTSEDRRFLVNRGFVPAPSHREMLPVTEPPAGRVNLVGAVWPFLGLLPVLDDDEWEEGWPKRIQRMEIARMADAVGAEPVEIRLEPGQAGVDQAAPFAAVLSDVKHRGYAATWFGLSIVLVGGFIAFGVRRARSAAMVG